MKLVFVARWHLLLVKFDNVVLRIFGWLASRLGSRQLEKKDGAGFHACKTARLDSVMNTLHVVRM